MPAPKLASLEPLWLALLVAGGLVGLPILVLTFIFSKRANAHLSLINFCSTWILYSLSYCLLLYTGQVRSTSPNNIVCQTQVAMIHGSPPMVTTSGLFLVISVWSNFHELEIPFVHGRQWLRRLVIVAPPYLIFLIFSLVYGIPTITHPGNLSEGHNVYCSIDFTPFHHYLVPAFSCGVIVLILCFELMIAFMFIRRWQHIKRIFPLTKRRPSISLSLRVALFTTYSGITLGICLMILVDSEAAAPYMIQASLPLAAFIVFSSQKEVWRTWCFWRTYPDEVPTGQLVVDRKMSSSSRPAYPCTPTSADLEAAVGVPWDAHRPDGLADAISVALPPVSFAEPEPMSAASTPQSPEKHKRKRSVTFA